MHKKCPLIAGLGRTPVGDREPMSVNSDKQTDTKRSVTFHLDNTADRDSTLVREVSIVVRADVSKSLAVQTAHSDGVRVEWIIWFWNESQLFTDSAAFNDALPSNTVFHALNASKSQVKLSSHWLNTVSPSLRAHAGVRF